MIYVSSASSIIHTTMTRVLLLLYSVIVAFVGSAAGVDVIAGNDVTATVSWKNSLTQGELDWIQKHPDIRIAFDPEFFPFEFRSPDGKYQGISSDYIKLFNERFGLAMHVLEGISWAQAVDSARHGSIDVLPCVGITAERSSYMLFSNTYIRYQRVILTRTNTPFISGLGDIRSMKVGVQASSSHEGYLHDHSSIKPYTFSKLEECLMALSVGKVDAVVANLASSAYWIRTLNLLNLKVAAPVSAEAETLHFAVRKDWPELVSILNKGISFISPDEQSAIEQRWVSVEYKPGIDPAMVWRIGLQVAMAIVFIIAIILVLTYRAQSKLRKKSLVKVQESQRRISLIYDTVADTIFNLTLEKDGSYIFSSVNQCFYTTTGFRADQIIGKRVHDVIPEPSLSLVLEKYTEAIRTKKIVRWEEVSEYPTGYLIGEVSIAPIFDDHGICTGLVGSVHDVTARKQAENEIKQLNRDLERRVEERTAELVEARDRAESADRMKSAFLATMSHELRTPLNSIIGFTGIMLQGLVGDLTEEQKKQLNMVKDSARHLLALINDVLDISKIEAGQLEISAQDFPLRQVIDRAVEVVCPMAEKKSLPILFENEGVSPILSSDRRRVEQILINLLNNAVKFTEIGNITILLMQEVDSTVRISIRDTGTGIKAEDFDRLFRPFQQLETGLTRRYEGTGLGLSICKKLSNLLGGDIEVQSDGIGKGCTFTLILPSRRLGNG